MSLKIIDNIFDLQKKKSMKITLERKIVDKIRLRACKLDVTLSNYIRLAVEYYWKHQKD